MRILILVLTVLLLAIFIDFNYVKAFSCKDFPDHPSCVGYQKSKNTSDKFPGGLSDDPIQENIKRNNRRDCYERNPIPMGMGC